MHIEEGVWYAAYGSEIYLVIWGSFATVMEVNNDKGTGEHGLLYKVISQDLDTSCPKS